MDKDKAQEQKPQEIELKIPIKFEVSKPTLTEIPKVSKSMLAETPSPEVSKPTMGQSTKEK